LANSTGATSRFKARTKTADVVLALTEAEKYDAEVIVAGTRLFCCF
jgi:hypothetical protein